MNRLTRVRDAGLYRKERRRSKNPRRLQRVADVDKCARLSRWGIRERTKKELALSKRDREYIAATYEPNEYEKKILGDKK